MNRPSEEQMETALDAARRMQIYGVDPHHLAHTLLYLSSRNQSLREVMYQVDRYIRSGLPETDLAKLRRQIDALRQEEENLEAEQDLRNSVLL